MTRSADRISRETTDALIEEYIRISIEQGDAIIYLEDDTYNRLFKIRMQIERELQRRPGDDRHRLLPLYDHPNIQVRLNAASATRVLAPAEARKTIEAIAALPYSPITADAGMALVAWDKGIWKPE
jgi:hypothetical protein